MTKQRASLLLVVSSVFLILVSRAVAQPVQLQDIQAINAFDLHPSGQIIAIAGRVDYQYGFWLYNTTTGNITVIETEHPILAISWSPDGTRIAGAMAGGNASLFHVYDTSSKQLLLSFEQGASPFYMMWNDDSSEIATIYSQDVYIRDIASGNIISTLSVSNLTPYSVSAIAWDNSLNQRLYGLIGAEQKIIVWDTVSGEIEEDLPISGYAETMTLSPDFTKLAVGTIDGSGKIFILNAFDGTQVALLDAESSENFQALVWQNNSRTLASFGGDYSGGSLRVWDTTTSSQDNTFTVNHYISPETLLLNYNDQIITNASDGTIIIAPLAIAGPDQTVHDTNGDGAESVILHGENSADDGEIVSYEWTENGSPIANGATPSVNLPVGPHTITLTVTDDDGATDTEEVVVKVNKRPVANAGNYQYVFDNNNGSQTVTLNGSASTDDDGTITSYVWTEGGTQIATGVSPQVSLAVGTHTITLTVTDNDGATNSNSATVTIQVDPLPGAGWLAFVSQRNTLPGWKSPSGQVGSNVWNVFAARDDGYLVQITRNTEASVQYLNPVWSPDHQKLAYTKAGDICIWTIATFDDDCDFTGASDINTTATEHYPAWSPDGAWLAYVSNFDGDDDIYKVPVGANGHPNGNRTKLTTGSGDGNDDYPDWRGNWIVYSSDRDGNYDIWIIRHDGTSRQQLVNSASGNNKRPAWSPNGNIIAYDTDTIAGGGIKDIASINVTNNSGTWSVTSGPTNRTAGITQDVTFMAWKKSASNQNTIAAVRTANARDIIVITLSPFAWTTPSWNTAMPEDDPDW